MVVQRNKRLPLAISMIALVEVADEGQEDGKGEDIVYQHLPQAITSGVQQLFDSTFD